MGHAWDVIELLWLLLTMLRAIACPRQDLVLENLLLRHQLAEVIRPTRTRPRPRLRSWDTPLWVLARRFCIAVVSTWHSSGQMRSLAGIGKGGVFLALEVLLLRWPAPPARRCARVDRHDVA